MLSPSPQYRPDIDGLRAIAVMLVMNFHALSDQVHLIEKGSVYLIEAIIDRVLGEKSAETRR